MMNRSWLGSIGRGLFGLALGLGLGIALGWWAWPVEYTDTGPEVLQPTYRDEYVLMAAAAYEVDGDLEHALARLSEVYPEDPIGAVVNLAERLIDAGGSRGDIRRLARLADLFGAAPAELRGYLEEGQ